MRCWLVYRCPYRRIVNGMLTREGWMIGITAGALLVLGRFLGVVELYVVGAALIGLVVVCGLRVRFSQLQLAVSRQMYPARVHAGTPARVELRLENNGSASTPVLTVRDLVSGTRGATLLVGPLASGISARAAYQLPTDRRGVLTVGPLDIVLSDSFGLTRSSSRAVSSASLVVFPHVDDVAPLPVATGHDPQATAHQPNAMGRSGDDFYALRNYVFGDDLRRVHWPASAHHGELMIRQHELPWQERTTVLLDNRAFANDPACFEIAVSAAASILSACAHHGDQVRLLTASGVDLGFSAGRAQLERALLHLAEVTLDGQASLQKSLASLDQTGGGGSLVFIVSEEALGDLQRLGGLRQRYGRVATVVVENDAAKGVSPNGSATTPATGGSGAGSSTGVTGAEAVAEGRTPAGVVLRVTASERFPEVWNQRYGARRPTRRPTAPIGPVAAR